MISERFETIAALHPDHPAVHKGQRALTEQAKRTLALAAAKRDSGNEIL